MNINYISKVLLGFFLSFIFVIQPVSAKGKGLSVAKSVGKAIISKGKKSVKNKSKVSLRSLSKADRQTLNNLPKSHGIYRFNINNSGNHYIGKSNNIQRRVKEHIRSGKLPVEMLKSLKGKKFNSNGKLSKGYKDSFIDIKEKSAITLAVLKDKVSGKDKIINKIKFKKIK